MLPQSQLAGLTLVRTPAGEGRAAALEPASRPAPDTAADLTCNLAASLLADVAATRARFGETWLAAQNQHVWDWLEAQAKERRRRWLFRRSQGLRP